MLLNRREIHTECYCGISSHAIVLKAVILLKNVSFYPTFTLFNQYATKSSNNPLSFFLYFDGTGTYIPNLERQSSPSLAQLVER